MNKPLRLPAAAPDVQHPKPETLHRSVGAPALVWGMVGFSILVILVGMYFFAREPLDALQRENAFVRGQNEILREKEMAVVAPSPTVQPTAAPTCDNYVSEIAALQELASKGKFAHVTELANFHLSNRELPPCSDAKLALGELAYTSALNDLFSTRELDGRAALLRWQEAETKAEQNGVSLAKRMPPLTIVSQAYNLGFWELGTAAFRQAWRSGAVDHNDPKAVHLYYALTRNWGYAFASSKDGVARQRGLVFLRTADEISRGYGLAAGEAYQDLTHFLGEDLRNWPAPDLKDPILAALSNAKGEK